jgi:hypothetical protein
MVEYLSFTHPTYDQFTIEKLVKEILQEYDYPKTDITLVQHRSSGNSKIETIPIKEFLKLTDNKIITPSGSIYKTSKEETSFFADLLKTNTKNRSIAKKRKLEAKAKGNISEVNYWENQQQQKKYDNN